MTGGGSVGECLRRQLTQRQYPIIAEPNGVGFGYTEVVYILEWNPAKDAPWAH